MAGLLHLFFNLMGIWFFGRYVEETLGTRHFLKIYLLSGVLGGVFQAFLQFLFPYHFFHGVVGASAGVSGLVASFALLANDAQVRFNFILPMKAITLFYISVVIELFFTIVPSDPGIAHPAHLAGLFCGYAYIRWAIHSPTALVLWRPWRVAQRREETDLVTAPPRRKTTWKRPVKQVTEELPPGEFISKEVDPILDKISAHGIHSLTDRERQILEAARKRMAKR
jgi:hypothetical protein